MHEEVRGCIRQVLPIPEYEIQGAVFAGYKGEALKRNILSPGIFQLFAQCYLRFETNESSRGKKQADCHKGQGARMNCL